MSLAVVTGAGRDVSSESLGFAICRKFLELGRPVEAWDRDEERLLLAAERLPGLRTRVVDIADPHHVQEGVEALDCTPSALVNCAAMTRHPWAYRSFADVTAEQLETEVSVTLLGTFHTTLAFARRMTEAGAGAIVNVSSSIYPYAGPFQLGYAASKAGVAQFTRTLAGELRSHGIRVNGVAPALVQTQVYSALSSRSRARILTMFADPTPLSTTDVADVVAYLIEGPGAEVITGQVVTLDHGFQPFLAVVD